ncbi:hypothetical protein GCM10010149_59030 [Nonomuraea roseoviolacea subsp. roseoviolacea]|uniref:MobF family relaxase n=1 Tax=Nonomuraea roseoviolacea TaxID=103837 RepID=UPI0031D0152E
MTPALAWLTVLGPAAAQIDYRLRADAGCAQVDYRLAGDDGQEVAVGTEPGRGLVWIGDGLREFGIEPGTVLTPEEHQAARRLMAGRDPGTGKRLVKPKLAVHPRAMLPGQVLLKALQRAAGEAGVSVEGMLAGVQWAAKRAGRLERGVEREREAYSIPVGDADRVAAAAGLDLDALYEPERLEEARAYRGERVQVGNRGYDLTLELPKSVSVLYGLADPALAAGIEDAFAAAVYETAAAVEQWAGYGMRGRHGDGKRAERIASTGLLGWVLWHRAARPVGGQVPDPHLHAHLIIANMLRGTDGKWSTLGAGGRDVHRHVQAAGTLVQARLRRLLTERYGIAWERDPHTGAWEIVGIGEDLRARFSKRGDQIAERLQAMGLNGSASTAQAKNAAAKTREDKTSVPSAPVDLRTSWAQQARAAGVDPARLTARCVGAARGVPARPSPEAIAAWIWRPEDGLTGHDKIVTRADVLAAVMDALPDGVAGVADADALTDQVLQHGPVIELPPAGAVHLTNSQRYTSSDITAAEKKALAATRAGYSARLAVVDDAAAALALDAYETGSGVRLSDSQRQVLERLLGDGHGVEAVIGVAGAGKTTIMAAARSAWECRGLVVTGAATAAVAAIGLAAESGIASSTIAHWLLRIENGPGLDGVDVLVVDEAAIVDDRQLAVVLTEAQRTATKVVLIGDPVQLRAIGVGGLFAAIHRQVDGMVLGENRRQRDVGERAALALWRDGQREQALRTWSQAGRVHAGRGADDTMAAMLADWQQARAAYAGDVHAELAAVALLAGSNADVDRLNSAARMVRRAAGEITGPEVRYRQPGGRTLALAVGDHVRIHTNDYRARRGQGANVLNGYRGRVMAFDAQRRVLVEWRAPHPDGPRLEREWIEADYIAGGGLSYGTALTVAATQGATVDRALVYGHGLDPHSLYAAMSRNREAVHLYLPRELLETDADRARRGAPDSCEVELQRALAAYAATLYGDRADHLLTPEPEPIARQSRPTLPALDAYAPDTELERARAELQAAEREAELAVQRARILQSLTGSPYGVGLVGDAELGRRMGQLGKRLTATTAKVEAAEEIVQRLTAEGGGHHERRLMAERATLDEQMRRIETAEAAAHRLQQNRQAAAEVRQRLAELRGQERAIERERAGLRPWQRARRRDLTVTLTELHHRQDHLTQRLAGILVGAPVLEEAARQAAAQVPPAGAWSQVRQRHAELVRSFDTALRVARERDIALARLLAHEPRRVEAAARHELIAIQRETARRGDLTPDQRDLEQLIRAEYAASRRADARQKANQRTHGGTEQRGPSQAYQPPIRRFSSEPHRGHDLSR